MDTELRVSFGHYLVSGINISQHQTARGLKSQYLILTNWILSSLIPFLLKLRRNLKDWKRDSNHKQLLILLIEERERKHQQTHKSAGGVDSGSVFRTEVSGIRIQTRSSQMFLRWTSSAIQFKRIQEREKHAKRKVNNWLTERLMRWSYSVPDFFSHPTQDIRNRHKTKKAKSHLSGDSMSRWTH